MVAPSKVVPFHPQIDDLVKPTGFQARQGTEGAIQAECDRRVYALRCLFDLILMFDLI